MFSDKRYSLSLVWTKYNTTNVIYRCWNSSEFRCNLVIRLLYNAALNYRLLDCLFTGGFICRCLLHTKFNLIWKLMLQARSPSAMSNRSGGYPPPQQEPEIQVIKLNKSNNGMGLSIVAAKVSTYAMLCLSCFLQFTRLAYSRIWGSHSNVFKEFYLTVYDIV
jgi:hypothetical protein